MRTLILAAGLLVAASFASAEVNDGPRYLSDDRIALSNGCVYAQNQLNTAADWSLIYTEAGTVTPCELTLRVVSAVEPALEEVRIQQAAALSYDLEQVSKSATTPTFEGRKRRIVLRPQFATGVFR